MNDDVRWIDCDLELLPDHLAGARLFSWTAWDGFRVARPVIGRVLQLHGESERVMPVVRVCNFLAGFADSPPPLTWMREPDAPFVVTSHGEQPNRAVRALAQAVGPAWSRAIDWPLPSDARNLAHRELCRRLRIAERIDPAGGIPGSVEPAPRAMIAAHNAAQTAMTHTELPCVIRRPGQPRTTTWRNHDLLTGQRPAEPVPRAGRQCAVADRNH